VGAEVVKSKTADPIRFSRRLTPALALLIAPLIAAERAEAACTPAAPVSDSIVTCTGTTNNQNGTDGYGDPLDLRNTINVDPGASVTGTDIGIRLTGNGNGVNADTINNSGTISGTGLGGIVGFSGIVNNNVGASILAPGAGSVGYFILAQGTLNNFGTISGNTRGVDIQNGAATNASTGTISGGIIGVIIEDEGLQGSGNAIVSNAGTITGGMNGVRFRGASGGAGDLTNSGLISSTDPAGATVLFNASGTVTNFGMIQGTSFGIQSAGAANVTNSGTIESTTRIAIFANSANGATVDNFGIIQAPAGQSAISTPGIATVKNSGMISGGLNVIFSSGAAVNVTDNSGVIQATDANGHAINAATTAIVNNSTSGTIQANGSGGVAIQGTTLVDVTNSGAIDATNSTAIVSLGGDAVVRNSGTITAAVSAILADAIVVTNFGSILTTGAGSESIQAFGNVDVTNSGAISATGIGSSAIAAGVAGNAIVTVNNTATGSIFGDAFAIGVSGSTDVLNAGTIRATADHGVAISAFGAANVSNSGKIEATGGSSAGIFANDLVTVINVSTGIISGSKIGIGSVLNAVDVNNFGTIQSTEDGGAAIQAATTATIGNSGTIKATGATSFGVNAATANVTNSGTISGNTGIVASGVGGVGSTITNSGTIAGTGGTAIKLSPAADTLTLLGSSRIIGAIDMGGGNDVVNIVNNVSLTNRVSSFFKLLSASTLNLINFTGSLNTTSHIVNTNGLPAVQSADGIATLDPTMLGQADRTLIDFTGGVASLVQGRLGGPAAGVSGMQVVNFAPNSANDRTNEAFAAISFAMAYGTEAGRMSGKAPSAAYAPRAAPYTAWASGFGGARTQKADDLMLRTTSSAWGGVIGIDRQVRSDLLLGVFAGGGTGRMSADLNSQSVDTDYIAGGLYGRFDWASYFLDFTLQSGAIHNSSSRLVLNNLAPSSSENATASYNGWYVSPELAFGLRYGLGSRCTITPVARVRYLAGVLDGYSEAGSVQNLSVGRRTLQDLEERAEVELSKVTGVSANAFKVNVHGGVIALQRLGSPTIDTMLIGQDLSFTTPGAASAAGVVAGTGFDFRAAVHMSLFGTIEGTLMSDSSRTIAARGGLRILF
jgi:outer membrane autotransporter protein